MSNPVGIAIIGAGFIGKVHARCVHENSRTRISAVYDVNAGYSGQLASEYSARHAASLDDALADADVAIIGTPAVTHGEIARHCVKRRIPFLCEKPLDVDPQSALKTAQLAQEAGVFAGIGFNRRFDDHYRALRHAVERGDLGRPETILMTSRTQSMPSIEYIAKSGGLLRDKGAHWFDLLCWLTQERPIEIFVQGSCLIDKRYADHGDVDTAAISIAMESGALCQMNFSRRTAYGNDERIELVGSEGMIQACPPIPINVHSYHGDKITKGGLHADWFSRIRGSYPVQLDALLDAVEGHGGFPTLSDGLVAETIALAGDLSLKEGRPVALRYDAVDQLSADVHRPAFR